MKCKTCGSKNREGVIFCEACGSRLRPVPAEQIRCLSCGSQIPATARVCGNCGHRQISSGTKPVKAARGLRPMAIIVAIVILIAATGYPLVRSGILDFGRPATQAQTPAATAIPPSRTPTRLPTSLPLTKTPTPRPTLTFTPTVDRLSQAPRLPDHIASQFTNLRLTAWDDFAVLDPESWVAVLAEGLSDKAVIDPGAPGDAYLYRINPVASGQGIVLTISSVPGEIGSLIFEISLAGGDWKTPTYRHVGLRYERDLMQNSWVGLALYQEILAPGGGRFSGSPVHVFFGVGENGVIRACFEEYLYAYCRDNQTLGWKDQEWNLAIHVYSGTLFVDDYIQVEFDALSGY